MSFTRQQRKRLETENNKRPLQLQSVPRHQWPENDETILSTLKEVWRSRDYLVQIYTDNDHERMSVCRTTVDARTDRWNDGITWDDLMKLKRQCGRTGTWAVELYPPDVNVVNVANMRHLWLLPSAPSYAWNKE